ncbi:hypothetical protein [Pseudomonas sp. MWU13-2105]|uniref:hypothetical protein n=1 Tax=Pseudomonas sp. MWU13-2105 TaxID=2935074 RepID=UPI00200CD87C|nr:hypothetical protein [Pseudomonas sp. MWU13-2105]
MKEDLIAPRVEQAAPEDGLLPVSELDTPLSVSLPLWPNARPDDRYQLTWNNALIGEPIKLVPPLQPGDILYSHIPLATLAVEGTYQLGYQIIRSPDGIAHMSQTTSLIIDRSPPGGTLLAALILPSIALDGLGNNELVALDNQLTVTVPGYFDMQWGDVIQSYWGELAGPTHSVKADQPGSDKVQLSVDRSFLEQLGNGEFALSYSIRDRAGNTSVRSQAVILKLQLQQAPANLQAPLAPQLDNGQVHDAQARVGVKIAVPTYTHVAIGDEICVLWNGERAAARRVISAHELGKPLLLNVMARYLVISRHGDGPARVNYQVRRNGEVFTSADLELEVFLQLPGPRDPTPQTMVNEALAAPVIKGKNPHGRRLDNYLDEDNAQLSADAVIAWRKAFQAGDRINLFWGQASRPLVRPITPRDVEAACYLVINVPNSLITEQGCGVDIGVQYTVTREGNPNTSYSPRQSVAVIFQMQLPGGSGGLMEPVFTAASVLNVVDPRKDPEGTVVLVSPYRNMKLGDRIVLRFCGFDALTGGNEIEAASFSAERLVGEHELRNGCRLRVPLARLMAIEHGRGRARYEVISELGRVTSLPADVYISSRASVMAR